MHDLAVSLLPDEYTQLDVTQLFNKYEKDANKDELPNFPQTLDERCAEMIRCEFAKKNRSN